MKVAVAMSGGVDSSVAAFLLKQQNHEVVGITLRLWHQDDDKQRAGGCCSLDDISDARRVCDYLGIKHYVLNFEKEFKDIVVENFVKEYLDGRTPNPCIVCNEKIKFDLLLKKTAALDFDYLATGHYGRIEKNGAEFKLKKGRDEAKDQSYVLYRLTQKELSRLILPLGDYTKREIRNIAIENKLPAAQKPESQEICFVDKDYASFLMNYLPDAKKKIQPGPILNKDGKKIGSHKGLPFYTIGQRSGLGLTSLNPLYVVKIDAKLNTLVVGEKNDVFSNKAEIKHVSWVSGKEPLYPCSCKAKIRRLHNPASVMLTSKSGKILAEFETYQPSITPGQSAVFYQGEYVIGGGIIY